MATTTATTETYTSNAPSSDLVDKFITLLSKSYVSTPLTTAFITEIDGTSSNTPPSKLPAERLHKHFSLGNLRDVVKTLRGEVTDAVLGIGEAYQQGLDELIHVVCDVYAEGNGGARKANEPAIPDVQRVRRVAEHVHELVDDLANPPLITLLVTFSDLPMCRS